MADSGYGGDDASDCPVRTGATIAAGMVGIVERELAVSDIIAFGKVDGDLGEIIGLCFSIFRILTGVELTDPHDSHPWAGIYCARDLISWLHLPSVP